MENAPDAAIVSIISKLLSDLVSRNDQLPLVATQVTPFHSSKPPAISVKCYLEDRILKYGGCSEETFILALIYMDQVVQFNPDFVISSLNVHRLLITAIMLASKFFDDVYYNNAYYARVGGISNSEVNSLEMEMLRMISFSLFVSQEQYTEYRGSLYSHVQPEPVPALRASTSSSCAAATATTVGHGLAGAAGNIGSCGLTPSSGAGILEGASGANGATLFQGQCCDTGAFEHDPESTHEPPVPQQRHHHQAPSCESQSNTVEDAMVD